MANNFVETLQYFDVQDHPLTLLELLRFHLRPQSRTPFSATEGEQLSTEKVKELFEIEKMVREGQIETWHGLYFLPGRQEIAHARWRNNRFSTMRMKRASKFLKKVRYVPFIEAAAVSGSEALNNSKEGSDIDILTLTSKNRIWLGRLFMTLFFQLTGYRRHGKLVADRFCLNHYVAAGKRLENDRNLYTAIEYVALIPFYGAKEILNFQKQNAEWINQYLQRPEFVEYATPKPSIFKRSIEKIFSGKFGDALERLAGKYQRRRIELQDYITVEEDELSFHPGSKGQQVLAKFRIIKPII